jgi:hypothetical protein
MAPTTMTPSRAGSRRRLVSAGQRRSTQLFR